MSEEYQVPVDESIPFDERFGALEHQCYLMYLQLNAITQLLVDKDLLKKEEIGALMDSMHLEVVSAVNKLQESEDEALSTPIEPPAEPEVTE
jgi:hypothetical protein